MTQRLACDRYWLDGGFYVQSIGLPSLLIKATKTFFH